MAAIDQTASAQQAIFDKLGIKTQTIASDRGAKETLGQQDFLKLMVTQLKNQDPFAPMENGDFIAQMAQFSTVAGISEINANLSSMKEQMKQSRIATASNLLGHSVLVPGNIARPDEAGEIHGVLDLPETSAATALRYTDAISGELLHSQDLGVAGPGLVGFAWADVPAEVVARKRPMRIEASVNFGDGPQSLGPSVYARVLAASAGGATSENVLLDVEDYGEIDAAQVIRFR
jgi:flagellar basal-body rod modification protein FlgD